MFTADWQEVEEDDDNNHNVDDDCDNVFEGTFKAYKHLTIYFQKGHFELTPSYKGGEKQLRLMQ